MENLIGVRSLRDVLSLTIQDLAFIEEMEKLLFDTETSFLSLLEIDTLIAVFKEIQQHVQLLVIDHGNGLWTTMGPDSTVHYLDEATFEVNAPTLIYLDAFTYTVESI